MTVSWSTTATSSSNVGTYQIIGKVSVSVGLPYSGDYTITQASGNATALTVTSATSRTGGGSSGSSTSTGVTTTQIVPVVQTVLGFDNVVTPSTASSGSSPSPAPSGSATPLSSSGASSLTIVLPTEDGMTGEGIISYETVTPSKRP